MTEFKFGDVVSHKNKDFYPQLGIIVGINKERNQAKVHFEGLNYPEHCNISYLELVKHPDTLRLDFVERVINIDGMVKREFKKGWSLVKEDLEIASPKPLLRDAIDLAIESIASNNPDSI